jgi:ppGpp synthetase/RelA/SpoT-type nucleotidyltranferase
VAKATKLKDGKAKYVEPLEQIQDQIGARIITFYPTDVNRLDPIVKKWFNPIEFKDHVPESEWEFGYFGRHYVLAIPTDIIDDSWEKGMIPPRRGWRAPPPSASSQARGQRAAKTATGNFA